MKNTITILSLALLGALNASAHEVAAYEELLKKYVKPTGVEYKQWHSNSADKAALDKILSDWSKVKTEDLSKAEKAAFRINLYNAVMVDVVLDRYPLDSVTKIGKAFSIFDDAIIATPSGKISLNQLEKKQLLKDFPDGRLHFAVNCASVSCPPLRAEAFVASKLEAQLDEQAKLFANSKHAVQVNGSTAKYSELFNWYKGDFKTDNPAIYLNKFRTEKLKTSLKVSWIKYDWGLNKAK